MRMLKNLINLNAQYCINIIIMSTLRKMSLFEESRESCSFIFYSLKECLFDVLPGTAQPFKATKRTMMKKNGFILKKNYRKMLNECKYLDRTIYINKCSFSVRLYAYWRNIYCNIQVFVVTTDEDWKMAKEITILFG